MKGKRIAIGRKARAAGFVAEFRHEENTLYVKRSDKPLEEKTEKSEAESTEEKCARKKKTAVS